MSLKAYNNHSSFFTDTVDFTRRNISDVGVDVIAGCLDYKRQKPVPIGDYYHQDDCTICLCSNSDRSCKQISCAPPTDCIGTVKKDPLHCCDVCTPFLDRPMDESSLNMKLGALTVTLFLIVSLILFTFHRLRRKRLLITLRRLRALRRQDTSYACSLSQQASTMNGARMTMLTAGYDRNDSATFDQNTFTQVQRFSLPEAPPTYASAVTLPRPPVLLNVAPPSFNSDPPPPYLSEVSIAAIEEQPTTTGRRTILSSVISALSTLRRQNGNNNGESDSQRPSSEVGSVAGAGVSSGTLRNNLAWRRSSETSEYQYDDGSTSMSASRDSLDSVSSDGSISSCCCSQCDGRSDDERSLSSNDVRPRSEMSIIRVNGMLITVTVPSGGDATTSEHVAANGNGNMHTNTENGHRLCDSCRMALTERSGEEPSTSQEGVVVTEPKSKKKKLCNKKLKKLLSRHRKTKASTIEGARHRSSSRRRRNRSRHHNPSVANEGDEHGHQQASSSSPRSEQTSNERVTSV